MSQSAIQQVWPAETVELSAEQKALAALRAEIDSLDDQILELFERRLAVAAQV
ncbi:MAG: chorismate mutase, partial [Bordetella sp.]|nr:chorismate mutase [Bordetella sp.]